MASSKIVPMNLIQVRNRDTDIKTRLVDTAREGEDGVD